MSNVENNNKLIYIKDPNSININNNIPYSIQNYEDMNIFVELYAYRRNRSTIDLSTNSIDSEDYIKISLMGYNQNESSNDYMFFTTNYTENDEIYENFGITNISIKINSSYIPQINITFVDIKGYSFFNNNKSKYRIFFDFPPPIFKLKIKGYYGMALEYDLHLVKYTSEFKSESGNFVIDANFIGLTFAPLTDVLFKYIVNTSLMDVDVNNLNVNPENKPINTYDLLIKLKTLYRAVKKTTDSKEVNDHKLLIEKLNYLNLIYDNLNINNISNYFTNNIIFRYFLIDNENNLILINDNIIKTYNDFNSNNKQYDIILGYYDTNEYSDFLYNLFINGLNKINSNKYLNYDVNVKIIKYDNYTLIYNKFNFYIELYNLINKIKNEIDNLNIKINDNISKNVVDSLGMLPTIRNVFKLILDDVDLFFNKMKKVSNDSSVHHEKYKNEIMSFIGEKNSDDIIYSFPLIINNYNGSKVKTRVSPKIINEYISEPFPESIFVDEFNNTFNLINKLNSLNNIRTEANENGVLNWIPITIMETIDYNVNSNSPYTYSNFNKGNLIINNLYSTIINRFYILYYYTFSYVYEFSTTYTNNVLMLNYVKLYSKAEAGNLFNSIKDNDLLKLLKNKLKEYTLNIDLFFNDLDNLNVENYNSFVTSDYINLDYFNPDKIIYLSNSESYNSVYISDIKPKISTNGNDYINQSINDYINNGSDNFEYMSNIKITEENLLYYQDGDKYLTKFISNNIIANYNSNKYNENNIDPIEIYCIVIEEYIKEYYKLIKLIKDPNYNNSINYLYKLFLLSTISIFNKLVNITNPHIRISKIFNGNHIIEVPNTLVLYIGLIKNITKDDYNNIITLINNNNLNKLNEIINNKFDIEFIDNNFTNYYNEFINDNNHIELLNIIYECLNNININQYDNKSLYNLLSSDKYNKFSDILFSKRYLKILSSETFKKNNNRDFIDLKTLYNLKKNLVIKHFKSFFIELNDLINNNLDNINKKIKNVNAIVNDDDIINQMYYSFKNINDKWINIPNNNTNGYPFNYNNKNLIDMFVFVDRAMNPIGDTIINPNVLLDLYNNNEATVFTVLSELLSMNRFEFFPLQNFMIQKDNFDNCFKITPNSNIFTRPTFICMYIGGSSSYPSNIDNGYVNDGIDDITDTDSSDFNLITDLENNDEFDYNAVYAFKVLFGQQNQSMFTDIKIDSKEYPETNESLKILSQISNDNNSNAPISKSQNLYSLYENRAYSSTVTGLGNAMIQPTQYFQLENIPIFNGAYIILSVQHDIKPNTMTTSFTGTKILRYPIPRVINPVTILNGIGNFNEFLNNENININNVSHSNYSNIESVSYIDTYMTCKYAKLKLLELTNNNNEISKAIFILIYNETRIISANNGDKVFKSAGNYNYAGIQTDSGKWKYDNYIISRFTRIDSGNVQREFASFKDNDQFLEFLYKTTYDKGFNSSEYNNWIDRYLNSWLYNNLKNKNKTKFEYYYNLKYKIFESASSYYDNI